MKSPASFFPISLPLLAFLIDLPSASAAIITTNESNTTNSWTFPVGLNLLDGATAHTPSAPQQPNHGNSDQTGASWSILTNNTVGAAANKMESVAPNNGNSVIFPLDVSLNPRGYNITSFDAYGAWPDTGRDNLDFTISYSTVAAPTTFIQLAVVANHTTADNATHTRLTDSTGVLASGVHSLRFLFGSPTGQENGFVGYREFIALGTAVQPDTFVWTGNSGSGGTANWTAATDNNWKKSIDGTSSRFNPFAPLVFDSTGINRSISVSPSEITAASMAFTNNAALDYTFDGQAVATTGAITASGAGNVAFNGVLQASGITLSGAGALSLNAANPGLSGTTSVSSGTLDVGNNGGMGTSSLAMSGGTARFTTAAPSVGGLSGTGGSIVLGNTAAPAGTHLSIGGTTTTSFAGTIGQAAGDVARITKTGGGFLALSGDNTYTGPTVVTGGSLFFNRRVSLYHGTTASWTAANMQAGNGGTLGFRTGGTGEFTAGELATMDLGGFSAGSSLGIDTSTDLTFTRVLTQPIGLVKRGSAILSLTGANTYSGTTHVTGGTLRLANTSGNALTGNVLLGDGSGSVFLNMGASNQFGPNAVITFANGTGSADAKFQLRGTNQTVAGLASPTVAGIPIVQNDESGTPGFSGNPGAATLTINAASDHSFRGIIRDSAGGALSLVKNGTGTQELINHTIQGHGFTGPTTINGGALKLTLSGNTTNWSSLVTANAGGTFQLDGNWSSYRRISGAGKVLKTGTGTVGVVNQDGNAIANNYSGGTEIREGTLKFISDGTSAGAGTAANQTSPAGLMMPTNVITVKNGATMGIGGKSALGKSTMLPQFAPSVKVEPGGKIWGGDGNSIAFIANVSLDGASIEVTNGASVDGCTTNIALVGTLVVGGGSTNPSSINTSASGPYANVSLGSLGQPGTTFQVADVTNNSSVDLSVGTVLTDVGGLPSPLVKTGPGTMSLQGTNTYTGETRVMAGTLLVAGNSIEDSGKLVINGGRLGLAAGANETVAELHFGSVKQAAGTYGSTTSTATFKDDTRFSGTGILTVTGELWSMPGARSWSPTSILGWDPATDRTAPYGVGQIPLAPRFSPPGGSNPALNTLLNVNPNARPNEGKVEALVGFSSSASQGIRSTRFYAPTSWQYMDIMGYWAGAVASICVPPGHVIDAAHRNGVPILGNVFLAPIVYGGSTSHIDAFLAKRANGSFPVADKMIQAARYFKFDGWFINMETEGGTPANATAMQEFMIYLKAQAPELKISWYDSMISNGGIAWQRRLNSWNQMFFQSGGTRVSDNISLDFYWQGGDAITSSASLAQSLGRSPYDIFAGIDTEGAGDNGTNTWGGSTPIGWEQLFPTGQPHRASLGIYRPDWSFNYSSNRTEALNREIRYWSGQNNDPSNTSIPAGSTRPNWPGIAHFIPAKSPLSTLPFVTHFSLGQGDRYVINGTTRMTGPWTNLSLQDILPTWKWIVSSTGTKLSPTFDYDTAYYGGTSLKVSGTLTGGQPNEIKLYQTSLAVESNTTLALTYKPSSTSAAQVQVGFAFEDDPATIHYTANGVSSSTAWTTLNAPLSAHAGRKIAMISVKLSSPSTISSYTVNLGRLAVTNGAPVAPAPPSALTLEGKAPNPDEAFGSQLWLSWTHSPDPVLHYNVYYRPDLTPASDSKRVWLGATPGDHFFAPDVRRLGIETSGYIQVEAVGPDLGIASSISTVQPTFEFDPGPDLSHPLITSYPVRSPMAVIASTTKADNVNAFDNSFITHVEPGTFSGEWVGLDLGAGNAKPISAIRYMPRATLAARMTNGVFQGSNNADFSGAVELARVNFQPPDDRESTVLVSVPTAFRYVRYLSPDLAWGNVAEIKFYTTGNPVAGTPPVNVQGTISGTTANLTWSAPIVGVPHAYNVKRATTHGGPYTTVASGLATTTFQNTGLASGTTYHYVVTAEGWSGESAASAQVSLNPPSALKLSGTVIGGGTASGSGTTHSMAHDAALSTYFESSSTSAWTGLDFGEGNGKSITGIRYSPRNSNTSNSNNANLLLGGCFQASNSPDFTTDVVTFISINNTAAYNTYTSVGVAPSTATYRYVRYVASSARSANISEVEFYGGSTPAAPTGLTASARDTAITLAWNTVPGATGYKIQRATSPGGPYVTVNANAPGPVFVDSGLDAGTTYYHMVSALNALGEGPPSQEVSSFDTFARWLTEAGHVPGAPDALFNGDADADGIQNGAEYMNPGGVRTGMPGASVVAELRLDSLVLVTLWQSTDMVTWSPATFVEPTDQSGVNLGFRRVLGPALSAGESRTFYRFEFAR